MMKTKRIAIDARFILRKQRGMPLYTFMLCKLLPKILSEHQFFILINKGFEHNDSPQNYQIRLDEICQSNNTTIINADAEDEISWEQTILPKLLTQHAIDLIHMPGNRVCLNTDVKQLVTFHDAMEWTSLNMFSPAIFKKGLRDAIYSIRMKLYKHAIYARGSKKADHILTISQYAANSLTECFIHIKDKIDFVYHGIPEGFENNEQAVTPQDKRKGILMLGGDSYQKNPENMIRAWAMLSAPLREQYPLTISGFTGGDDSILMKTLVACGVKDEVKIHGWVTHEQLIDFFANSTLLLFASREEGFGFPLLQAMSLGTPVICSNAGVLKEIGQNAVLSADAEDYKALSNNIELALTAPAIWQNLQDNAVRRAKDFSWQITGDKIAKVYNKLLMEDV
ncbi:glycosyltransferase family 4 protein [Catenovulum agarivorans]|nr:glycosyltransferase family 1 protein [Catenovulum agarivorans]